MQQKTHNWLWIAALLAMAAPVLGQDALRVDGLVRMPFKMSEVDVMRGRGTGSGFYGALGFIVSGEAQGARLYRPVFPAGPRLGTMRLGYGTGIDAPTSVVDFGLIAPPGASGGAPARSSDWVAGTLSYDYGQSGQLTLTASRLTPALLARYTGRELIVFGGPKKAVVMEGRNMSLKDVPGNPRYVAFGTAQAPVVRALSGEAIVPPAGLTWMLTWLGENSYFVSSSVPCPYAVRNCPFGVSGGFFNPADLPMLVLFENPPTAIRTLADGGLQLSFADAAGASLLMPLHGDVLLPAGATEQWGRAGSLPARTAERADWWREHLAEYPLGVQERWTYDAAADRFTVEDTFRYVRVAGHAGKRFAPLSPMVAVAIQEGLPIEISPPLVDSGLATQIGPCLGVEGVDRYQYSVAGMAKYVRQKRILLSGAVPDRLRNELETQVARVVAAGHLAPFYHHAPSYAELEELIWDNPGDTPRYLLPALGHLGEPLAERLRQYVMQEIRDFPLAASSRTLRYDQGARREDYELNPRHLAALRSRTRESYPAQNLYALWLCYSQPGGQGLAANWPAIRNSPLVRGLVGGGQDWATLGRFNASNGWWDYQKWSGCGGVVDTNANITGLIGYLRLAEQAGETDPEALTRAWGLYHMQLIQRYAQWKLAANLYRNSVLSIPADKDWLARASRGVFESIIYPAKWDAPEDDIRQPCMLDEFGVSLHDVNRYRLAPFMHLCPELGRFFADHLRADAARYLAAVERFMGDWFLAFKETNQGQESGVAFPEDSHQLFMARAWVLGEAPGQLERYIDVPWVPLGDYYYIDKLTETIAACRGAQWRPVDRQADRTPDNSFP